MQLKKLIVCSLVFYAFTENEGVSGGQEPDNEAAGQT